MGLDAARAWNRPSFLAARLALALKRRPENAGISEINREAERDTTGSISRQPLVHTWIGAPVQGKRRGQATLLTIHWDAIMESLTLWS